jgi:uncharacterized membrane protein
MTEDLLHVITLLGALGCGVMAGVFFAFSTFVMRALARVPPAQGIAAMQSINVTVLNPVFLGTFLGTALVCAALGVVSFATWPAPRVGLLAGALFYLVGTFLVTVLFNVPRNEALAQRDAADPQSVALWNDYLRTWTRWNHVRTVSALAAAAMLTASLP